MGEGSPLSARLSRGRADPARVRALLSRLGHPEARFPVIQVGGTNGEGAVVALLEAVFAAAGVRVGAYTSPDSRFPLGPGPGGLGAGGVGEIGGAAPHHRAEIPSAGRLCPAVP